MLLCLHFGFQKKKERKNRNQHFDIYWKHCTPYTQAKPWIVFICGWPLDTVVWFAYVHVFATASLNTARSLCIRSQPSVYVTCPQNVFTCMFWQSFFLYLPPVAPKTYKSSPLKCVCVTGMAEGEGQSNMCSVPSFYCQMALTVPLRPNLILIRIDNVSSAQMYLSHWLKQPDRIII